MVAPRVPGEDHRSARQPADRRGSVPIRYPAARAKARQPGAYWRSARQQGAWTCRSPPGPTGGSTAAAGLGEGVGSGQVDASAQIALGQFPSDSCIGIPVPLFATRLAFFACCVGAMHAMEGERGDLGRPDEPSWAFRDQVQYFVFLAVMQFVHMMQRRPSEKVGCELRHVIFLLHMAGKT